MFEVQILIPVADNDGKAFSPDDHKLFEMLVVERFGGVTLLPSEAMGVWADSGRTYHDQTRVYVVALRSIVHAAKLGELVELAKLQYRQEAIYIRYLGVSEIL